jgi:hypothetical protein
MLKFLLRPLQKTLAVLAKVFAECVGGLQFGEDRLLLAANIEVDEGNADLLQV